MAGNFTYDVFLNYHSHDKYRVEKLAARLQKAGLQVWFDEWQFKSGEDIQEAVKRGLNAARSQVLCLSQAALESNWIMLERSTVPFRNLTNDDRRFIPVILDDFVLPETLRRYSCIDYRAETQAAFQDLLIACRAKPEERQGRQTPTAIRPANGTGNSARHERSLWGHKGWVRSLDISSDGTWFASGSEDKTIKTWDLDTGSSRVTLTGHEGEVRSVAITPDCKRILSGSDDGSVRLWEEETGHEILRMTGHTSGVLTVIAIDDNSRALSAGLDKTLRLWELDSGECVKTIECGTTPEDDVFSATVNKEGTQALSGHRDGSVRLWDLITGHCLATIKGHNGIVYSIQGSDDWRVAASGSEDATVKVWDIQKTSCVGTLEGHRDVVPSVAISSNGALIASAGAKDISIRIWNSKTGACERVITLDEANMVAPISCALNTDGTQLIVGTSRHQLIKIFSLDGMRAIQPPEVTRRYVNAKIVLVGEGTVGKTSLAHRLIEDKYVIKDRTHGMSVWPLPLPVLPSATEDREALLWDLAGQEDYRLIHQLFLDQTALALLLINPQSSDPFAEAGDWLKALDMAAGNDDSNRKAPRLLVFSQIDVGGMKLGNAKIERFVEENHFANWLATSAKTGQNCSDKCNGGHPSKLKQLITENVPWAELPWTATPRILTELKNAILSMRDTADIRLLRFSELAQRVTYSLPNEEFGEADLRTALKLLANHGLARQLTFGDLVLLQPSLLSGYAGAIIRSARAHQDEIGCAMEADIYHPGFDFTGVDRLERPDEELLLRAIVQTLLDHSLCIAEETSQGRQLVFPSQFRREKEIPWQPPVFISYTFRGEWQTIWTTLVVRLWYSHEFEHRELWRNAAEFSSNRGDLLGLKIDNQQGEGKATISLFFDPSTPDELKVIFIEYVHRHLAKCATDVTRDRRYICPECSTPIMDLAAVQRRLASRKNFITCQECDERVPLIEFIEQRLKSDPVARKILAMEERTTQELDSQALEQILIGHVMATCGEANQIYRPVSMFDYGIDGEIEFKDNDGRPSGKKVYLQLKSGNSYLRTRRADGSEIFDVSKIRHLEYWISQPVDVYLVIRQTNHQTGEQVIRWMNVTRYLRNRKDKNSRTIRFDGIPLTMDAIWGLRDNLFALDFDNNKDEPKLL